MCGICGKYTKVGVTDDDIMLMSQAIAHRGPDDEGFYVNGRIGLANRRLSIIDLSAAGHQPMSNEDGTVWITYNGEFYNFQDYRAELEAKGHVFRSHCDTETIIHLYEEYGIDETLRRINGMFGFALWDSRTQKLYLARDRAGQKPLFYSHGETGSLLFGSAGCAPSGRSCE